MTGRPLFDRDHCEEAVYVCACREGVDVLVVWVKEYPEVRAEGPDRFAATVALSNAIRAAGGALHPVLEFDPPLPKSESEIKYATPELYLISGDERFETALPRAKSPYLAPDYEVQKYDWTNTFFQSPICKSCAFAMGPRTETPLSLKYAPRHYDGAFGGLGKGADTVQIVSAEFLELLTGEERRALELRPVTVRDGARQFYEVLGPSGPQFVAVAGLPVAGWRCETCDHRIWGYWLDDIEFHSFIAASDLPSPLPSLFTIGGLPGPRLCVTAERWRSLVGRKGASGFTSTPLGVVQDDEVIRVPDLPTRQEAEAQVRWRPRSGQ